MLYCNLVCFWVSLWCDCFDLRGQCRDGNNRPYNFTRIGWKLELYLVELKIVVYSRYLHLKFWHLHEDRRNSEPFGFNIFVFHYILTCAFLLCSHRKKGRKKRHEWKRNVDNCVEKKRKGKAKTNTIKYTIFIWLWDYESALGPSTHTHTIFQNANVKSANLQMIPKNLAALFNNDAIKMKWIW